MSVCSLAYLENHMYDQTSQNVLCMLPVAEARSFSDGVVICYVLPVSGMTSYFNKTGPWTRNKNGITFKSLAGSSNTSI